MSNFPSALQIEAGVANSSIHLIEKYLSQRYEFRYNIVTAKVEKKSKLGTSESTLSFYPMEDYDYNSLHRELLKAHIDCSLSTLRNLLKSDFVPKWDPFKHYLDTLPKWDGTDYIGLKADTIKTTNQEGWKKFFEKWFVALTASIYRDEIINHTALIFTGKQGIGKTTWLLGLAPNQLKRYRYSGTINFGNKDSTINLAECMLVNMDELENMTENDIGKLKELITKPTILIRRPYGYVNEELIRRASFVGSVNGREFLNDMTGNRRFLCFETLEIDYKTDISLDGMFAQALHLFNTGFQYWFNQDEMNELNINNEEFKVKTLEEEALLKYFEPCDAEDKGEVYMTTTEIAMFLAGVSKLSVSNKTIQLLGKLLSANNFKREKKQGRYKYLVKAREPEQVIDKD